jgi:hypothetical protein
VNVNPDPDIVLEPGDTILVIAPMEALLTLESMNQSHESTARSNKRVKVATKIQAEDAGGSPPSEAVLM